MCRCALWGGCWTEAAQLFQCSWTLHAGSGPASPGPAPGSLWYPSAVLAISWKQLLSRIVWALEAAVHVTVHIKQMWFTVNPPMCCWVLCTQVIQFSLGTFLYFLKQSSNLKNVIFYYTCGLVCFCFLLVLDNFPTSGIFQTLTCSCWFLLRLWPHLWHITQLTVELYSLSLPLSQIHKQQPLPQSLTHAAWAMCQRRLLCHFSSPPLRRHCIM